MNAPNPRPNRAALTHSIVRLDIIANNTMLAPTMPKNGTMTAYRPNLSDNLPATRRLTSVNAAYTTKNCPNSWIPISTAYTGKNVTIAPYAVAAAVYVTNASHTGRSRITLPSDTPCAAFTPIRFSSTATSAAIATQSITAAKENSSSKPSRRLTIYVPTAGKIAIATTFATPNTPITSPRRFGGGRLPTYANTAARKIPCAIP